MILFRRVMMGLIALVIVLLIAIGLSAFAIWKFPQQVWPYIPPSLALYMSSWGHSTFSIAQDSLYAARDTSKKTIVDERWVRAIGHGLAGTPDEQMSLLHIFSTVNVHRNPEGPMEIYNPPGIDGLMKLILDPSVDPRVQIMARQNLFGSDIYFEALEPLRSVVLEESVIAPGDWRPGRAARLALLISTYVAMDYDRNYLPVDSPVRLWFDTKLAELLACDDGHNHFATDPRDQAQVLICFLSLFNSDEFNTVEYHRIYERTLNAWLGDGQWLANIWQEDTTMAILAQEILNFLYSVNGKPDPRVVSYQTSSQLWQQLSVNNGYRPWRSKNNDVPASDGELYGAECVLHRANRIAANTVLRMPPSSDEIRKSSPFGLYLAYQRMNIDANSAIDWPNRKQTAMSLRIYKQLDELGSELLLRHIVTSNFSAPHGLWPARGPYSAAWETIFNLQILQDYSPTEALLHGRPLHFE